MRNTLAATALMAFALSAAPAMAATAPITVTNVLTTDEAWNGSDLPGYTSSKPELKVNHFTIKPGAVTSVHMHPANGAGYIISGELTMYSTSDTNGSFDDKSKVKSITLKAGDAWAESVNSWHYGVNKGEKDAVFVVVFASEEDVPATMSLVEQYVK